MNPSPSHTCPSCGAPLPATAPEGLCPRCLMAGALEPTQDATAPRPRAAPPDLETLRAAFPQLEILELIGQGGMGAVYRARQPQLDRTVALKILTPPSVADPRFAERFQREAQALARLSHPHIVTIHDFGKVVPDSASQPSPLNAQPPLFYLLMEFVDGVNLRQAMQAGRFTPAQALAIVPPICEALQYAHDQGVVHRDIKPENLLLDKAGRVKIADFGIARIMGASLEAAPGAATPDAAGLTQESALGTPQYMAPEQSTQPAQVDHRADIYSLGVVLYELLTGELPASKLVAPSRKVQVDVRLDEVVLRALQERPELRYHTALEFKTQLEEIAAKPAHTGAGSAPAASGSPVAATDLAAKPARNWRRRYRPFLVILGVLVLLVLLVAAVFTLGRLQPREYYSKVTMEVIPVDREQPIWRLGSQPRPPYDPTFVLNQLNVLLKTEILFPVIERLDLERVFVQGGPPLARTEAFRLLMRALVVKEIRGTSLIEIGVFSHDPQLAANIANTIAVIYQEKQLEASERAILAALERMTEEVKQQRKVVEQLAVDAARLRTERGILDPDPDSLSSTVSIERNSEETPATLEQRQAKLGPYLEAKNRYIHSRKVLGSSELSLATERMNITVPTVAKIWEKAERSLYPVNPWFPRFR